MTSVNVRGNPNAWILRLRSCLTALRMTEAALLFVIKRCRKANYCCSAFALGEPRPYNGRIKSVHPVGAGFPRPKITAHINKLCCDNPALRQPRVATTPRCDNPALRQPRVAITSPIMVSQTEKARESRIRALYRTTNFTDSPRANAPARAPTIPTHVRAANSRFRAGPPNARSLAFRLRGRGRR